MIAVLCDKVWAMYMCTLYAFTLYFSFIFSLTNKNSDNFFVRERKIKISIKNHCHINRFVT